MILDLFYKTGGFAMMPEDLPKDQPEDQPEQSELPPALLN